MFDAPRFHRPDRDGRDPQTAPRPLMGARRPDSGLFPGWGPHL